MQNTPLTRKETDNIQGKTVLNSTFVAKEKNVASSKVKGKPLKEKEALVSSSTLTNATHGSNPKNFSSSIKIIKVLSKTVKPSTLAEPLKQHANSAISKTPVKKGTHSSYAMTPQTSFVSYDISDIKSDDSDEEETANSKPIPSWATGVLLRNALLHQHHYPVEVNKLFGNYFEVPDLSAIMGSASCTQSEIVSANVSFFYNEMFHIQSKIVFLLQELKSGTMPLSNSLVTPYVESGKNHIRKKEIVEDELTRTN
ncbi:INCENP_ARK-bind domain-containing protein [Caerostris extrusa]|uniref:INCENP_ARK-bind domain-containing protein n=1 Tax=Caerostris extrusa TaxID=172846 RepID=A0AAV4UZW5_CAEEX|nr:INCENP_ARK-bind domain-containing protein [Caerostris extrusa]